MSFVGADIDEEGVSVAECIGAEEVQRWEGGVADLREEVEIVFV